jgi:ketosteroid isomerase-like protein
MAETPEETIKTAAEAYIAGDDEGLYRQLDDTVHILGSEQRENWDGQDQALRHLSKELEHRRAVPESVSGSLVDYALAPDLVHQRGDMAWWSGTGDLNLDGAYHRETSWTVVLSESEGDWKIVHSHFSIHR